MKKIILSTALLLCAFVQFAMAQNAAVSAKFNKSLQTYYALKNALATDKPADAQKGSAALIVAIKEVPHKGFATDAQHQLWMEESALIQKSAAEMAASDDLKVQRKSFRAVSDAFVKLATELKVNDKNAFVQYCPMGKYTWLNEVKEVQNPFYGSQMYDCGEVKETLAKK